MATGGTSGAQDISTGTIKLDDVLTVALKNNPELKAARLTWEAAAQLPAQTGAFDDPAVAVSHMLVDLQTKAGPLTDKVSITQKFPFWGKRGLRREAASMEAEVTRQAYRAKALAVAARTVRAFYGLYFTEKAIVILDEQQGVLDGITEVADKKYATGKAPQAMVFRAQVELAKLGEDLITARQELLSARAALNALLNRPPAAPLGSPAAPPDPSFKMETEELSGRALAERPEILALKALEGKRESERRLALRQYFPDFMLGYEYSFIGSGTTAMSYDGKDAQGVMIGFNIPLWLGKNKAAVKGTEAAHEASRASLEDMRNQTGWQVEDLSVKADTAARLFALYRTTVLPQASGALASVQAAYQADEAGFMDLLDSQRALLGFELQQERNVVNFAVAMAELARVTGAGPDGRKYE